MSEKTKSESQVKQQNMLPEEEIFRQRKDKLARLREETGYTLLSKIIGK